MLAVANAVDLIDRACTTAIVGLANETDYRVRELQATGASDFSAIVARARDVSTAVQQLADATAARIDACGRESADPVLSRALETLRKVLPLLLSSLRISMMHPEQDGVRLSAEYAYNQITSATASLRAALQCRVALPPDRRMSDLAKAATDCMSLQETTSVERSNRALQSFQETCNRLTDRGLLESSRDQIVLGQIARCGRPGPGESAADTCVRVGASIARHLARHAETEIELLQPVLHEVSVRPGSPEPLIGGQQDPLNDAGSRVHSILEKVQIVEELGSLFNSDSPPPMAERIGVQIRELVHSDLSPTIIAHVLCFWLDLVRRQISDLSL